jgi:hypothetical protein
MHKLAMRVAIIRAFTSRRMPLLRARGRERVVPISELVFGALTQNRSSLEPSLGFAAITGTPRIENGASGRT